MSSSTTVVDYSPEEIQKAHEVLYNEGLRMRIKVAGKEYVEKSLNAAKDPFSKPMQEVLLTSPISFLLSANPYDIFSSWQKPAGAGSGHDQALSSRLAPSSTLSCSAAKIDRRS
jgi:hypothetical protein